MSESVDIKHIIRTCPMRDDFMHHKRNMREVICREQCLPCLRVVELGKCESIIKAFKENVNDKGRSN